MAIEGWLENRWEIEVGNFPPVSRQISVLSVGKSFRASDRKITITLDVICHHVRVFIESETYGLQ